MAGKIFFPNFIQIIIFLALRWRNLNCYISLNAKWLFTCAVKDFKSRSRFAFEFSGLDVFYVLWLKYCDVQHYYHMN